MRRIELSVRALAFILFATLVLSAAPSSAQPWPQRAVRVIVPLPPGVPTDLVCRLFADRLSERWRQPVIVENRQGADGIPAVSGFVSARDDHTLLCSFPGIVTINPLIHEKLPYDPDRDVVPVVSLSDNFIGIAASAALKVNSLEDFVKLARSQPGKLNWAASPGNPLYGFAAFSKNARIEMVQVSYRDFRPALQDVGEGRIQAVATGVPVLLPHAQAGKVKLLMVHNRQRSPQAPEVPTATEAGYPELTLEGLTGFYGWRDMPADVREGIAADARAVAADSVIAARVVSIGSALRVGTPGEFAAAIEGQRAKIVAIARTMKPTQ
jgi:tripartite-type tricarboxylate transporter receptor subunit TctC